MTRYVVTSVKHPRVLLHYARRFDPNIGGMYSEGNEVFFENNTLDLTEAMTNWLSLDLEATEFTVQEDTDLQLDYPFSDFIAIIYVSGIPQAPQPVTGSQLILNFDTPGIYHIEIIKGLESNIIEVVVS